MAIKISNTTVIDDSRSLQNITGGAVLGIQSAGTPVGVGVTTLNFIGTGNTFSYNPSTKVLDISIEGGGGSGSISTTGIITAALFSNPSFINTNYNFDDGTNNYAIIGPVGIDATIVIGVGNTFVVI